ncbi:MAG: preprotein translocase subunit YajC [Desulfobacteraceae bacterium]|nr:preprotein translocase subunit YajC [Desulfobacteraceae bacterium]MCF8094162.1 preprotein translocase subunit YajC [Desulfobacteraceae bacterium]
MGQGGSGAQGGGFAAFVPIILMFVIFYFLLIRPQQKKTKAHQEMINNLKKGDRVITSGGIHGTVTSLDENAATVEIAEKVRVKVTRGSIAGVSQPAQDDSQKK